MHEGAALHALLNLLRPADGVEYLAEYAAAFGVLQDGHGVDVEIGDQLTLQVHLESGLREQVCSSVALPGLTRQIELAVDLVQPHLDAPGYPGPPARGGNVDHAPRSGSRRISSPMLALSTSREMGVHLVSPMPRAEPTVEVSTRDSRQRIDGNRYIASLFVTWYYLCRPSWRDQQVLRDPASPHRCRAHRAPQLTRLRTRPCTGP